MIFDQPPAELPVATIVSRDPRERVRADLRAWLAAKWQWFRPRTIPMIVAFVGMLAVIGSASYLRDYARRTPERLTTAQPDEPQIGAQLVLDVAPPAMQPFEPAAAKTEPPPPPKHYCRPTGR